MTPLSGIEKGIVAKLGTASFPPATASKRFAHSLSSGHVTQLSDKGRKFLAYVVHRFRRQYVLSDEEHAWVAEWINFQVPVADSGEQKEDSMNKQDQNSHMEALVKFLKLHADKPVKVCGMWTGDFIGTVTSVGHTQVSFRVEKPAGDAIKIGDTVTFPYGQYLKVLEVA